jgi:hypothetical protein
MPQGLECYNAVGQLVLGTADSLSKVIGTVTTQQNVAGAVTVPAMDGGTRVFIFRYAQPLLGAAPASMPRSEITVNGRTINWTAGQGPVTFSYGVY